MAVLLIIKSSDGEQQEVNLAKMALPFSIGRSGGSADIQINDPQLSRSHCKIQINEQKKLELIDLDSSNGTWLNGNDIDSTFLKHGDVIRIGGSTIDISALENSQNNSLVGRTIAGYEINAVIGKGSSATVFRGTQVNLGRPVALKIMHRKDGQKQSEIDAFMREAREAGSLNHQHVVQVHDAIEEGDIRIIVMEIMEGACALTNFKRTGPCSYETALIMLQQIGRALSYAADNRLIHRDVKPANILQTDKGVYKLADLGIATRMNSDGGKKSRNLVGTPLYMAPEQARGDRLDARSDIYGLGATVWHLLTGSPMFEGNAREVVAAQMSRATPDLAELVPGLDPGLVALIMSMVAKNPDERPASGQEVADRAAAFVGHAGDVPEPGTRRRVRRARRSRAGKASSAGKSSRIKSSDGAVGRRRRRRKK